jgi:hypothetical protein
MIFIQFDSFHDSLPYLNLFLILKKSIQVSIKFIYLKIFFTHHENQVIISKIFTVLINKTCLVRDSFQFRTKFTFLMACKKPINFLFIYLFCSLYHIEADKLKDIKLYKFISV